MSTLRPRRPPVESCLFGLYCAIVVFGTFGRRRTLSLFWQTVLGIEVALAITAICDPSLDGFAVAAVLGLVLGFTADLWVEHVRPP